MSLDSQILPTSSAPVSLPDHVRALAAELTSLHGSIRLATESSGVHFYLPCPECLKTEGITEVYKKHLAFNIDKFFAGEQRCVLCMKCGFFCDGAALSFYVPLEDRGIDYKPEVAKISEVRLDYLEADEQGRMVPKKPGVIIPVNHLPPGHPGRWYLESRGFKPSELWKQFQCSWCETENPDIYYRRQPGGFKITPQGRLIFFCLINGAKVGWQARILEFDENDQRFFWHPYKREWVPVLQRDSESGKFLPREGYEEWDPAKYWTAPGTKRNNVFMGFDAAMQWNLQQGYKLKEDRFCALVEGPLDSGRLGPPAMATLGKSLTLDQANMIVNNFYRVIIIRDNDTAGELLMKSAQRHFSGKEVKFEFMDLPKMWKDPGSLDELNAKLFMTMVRKRAYQL